MVARIALLLEGPFRRAYPYRHELRGETFVVKDAADDLALHEALAFGGRPADHAFLKERGMRYHDEAKPLLCEIIMGERAGKDMSAQKARLQELVYKMTLLLNRADPGPDSTPRWVKRARRHAHHREAAPIPCALDVDVDAMTAGRRSNYGARSLGRWEKAEPSWRAGAAFLVPHWGEPRAPPVRGP